VEFSRELLAEVLSGDIIVTFPALAHPKVKVGGRSRVGPIQDDTLPYRIEFHLVEYPGSARPVDVDNHAAL
jgi:hypothetical protein